MDFSWSATSGVVTFIADDGDAAQSVQPVAVEVKGVRENFGVSHNFAYQSRHQSRYVHSNPTNPNDTPVLAVLSCSSNE